MPFSKIRRLCFDVSWRHFALMLRLRSLALPVVVFRGGRVTLGRHARIVRRRGLLHLGKRWDIEGYRASELKICQAGTLEIDGEMAIHTGCRIDICPGATISLGSGYINNGARIVAFERIAIGHGVAISENVTMRDSDNHEIMGSTKPVTAPIVIGNNVWIGINATILKGVTVGDGAVIAANALVNRDVPPSALVAGVPARVIREDVDWK